MILENSRLRLRLSDIESQLLRTDNSEDDSPSDRRTTRQGARMKQERKRELKQALMAEKAIIENSLRLIVYPILTIPVEITSEIFLRCLAAIETAPSRPSTQLAPLLLGRICRTWRDIAYTSPRLWAVLKVSSWSRTDWVKDWLRRADSAPLSLRLTLYGNHCSFFKSHVCHCPSFSLFADHWKHLTSFYGSGFTLTECITLLTCAPRLIRCEIPYINAFSSAPNTHILHTEMEDLVLARHPATNYSLLLLDSLTLPNLRSLSFGIYGSDAFTNDMLSSFLQRASRIQTLILTVPPIGDLGASTTILDVVPPLTSLELRLYFPNISFDVLHRLKQLTAFLPRLESLLFSVDQPGVLRDDFATILLDALLSRWDAKITTQLVDFQFFLPHYAAGKFSAQLSNDVAKLEAKGMRIYVGPNPRP